MTTTDVMSPFTAPLGRQRRAKRSRTLGALIAAPLIFIFAFVFCYVSALHAPTPHELPLGVVAPSSSKAQLESRITEQAGESAFRFLDYSTADEARKAITERVAFAAVVIEKDEVLTIVASSAGVSGTSMVKRVGADIAIGLRLPNQVTDVAPTRDGDASGTGIFFLFVVTTVGSYLVITMLYQAHPRARLRTQLLAAVGAALAAPLICFALSSFFVGDYGADPAVIAQLLGVTAMYGLTIALLAIVLVRTIGRAASLACNLLLTAFNLPSAGGAVAAGFLPAFWQGVHGVWVGAGAFEAMRSVLYFDGAQAGRWISQLLVWTIAAVVGVAVIGTMQFLRQRSAAARGNTSHES
jgi:hypothetical protein